MHPWASPCLLILGELQWAAAIRTPKARAWLGLPSESKGLQDTPGCTASTELWLLTGWPQPGYQGGDSAKRRNSRVRRGRVVLVPCWGLQVPCLTLSICPLSHVCHQLTKTRPQDSLSAAQCFIQDLVPAPGPGLLHLHSCYTSVSNHPTL